VTGGLRRIDELPWQELQGAIEAGAPVMVPVGAVEPHGHHAPLGTDVFIALEIAERLAGRSGGVVFPPLPLGTLDVLYEFRSLPGSISVDADVLMGVVTNIGTELGRHGFTRIVLVNGHGPNAAPLLISAFRIRQRCGAQVGVLDWWTSAASVVSDIKGFTWGTHADEIETSIVMATGFGHLVDLNAAVVNAPQLDELDEAEKSLYILKVPFTRTLDERYVGRSGNMGDPSRATAEKGDRILEETVSTGLKLLDVLALQARLAEKGGADE
jgi:creatinine amidohydrolase